MIVTFYPIQKAQGQAKMNSNTSDIIVSTAKPKRIRQKNFSSQYREKIFYVWYNHGKPGSMSLLPFITPEMDEWERLPSKYSLDVWIEDEFVPRAAQLDSEIKKQLDAQLIAEKVEMLRRHADVGLKMQDMAIEYLNENREELSAPAAVRLLVEGIRIERESRGIPAALDKIRDMSDEKLMEQIKEIVTSSNVTLEDINADS
jgi:hypothetical protein